MKCIVLLCALSALCAVSALPAPQHGMFFYQGLPASYYRQAPVHRMYLQYQQPYRAAAQRRSAFAPNEGISAYVAGNQVAASGSFLKGLISRMVAKKLTPFKNVFAKDLTVSHSYVTVPTPTSTHSYSPGAAEVEQAEPETLADDIPVAVEQDDDGAVSIAEAYPAPAADEADLQDDEAPLADEVPQQNDEEFVAPVEPLADPVIPAAPKKKNKVTVELDTSDDEPAVVQHDDLPVRGKKPRPAYGGAAPAKPVASNPINTFFPINFGNTNGGAIAVANAYSTGQKGGARSHAIAYGSPAAAAKKQKRRQTTAAAAVEQ